MHSAIIQISREPIGGDNYINVERYNQNGFIPEYADYVRKMDDSERAREISSLDSWLRDINCGKIEDDVLYVTNKENFFKIPYENFTQGLEELNKQNSFETFVNDDTIGYAIDHLKSVFSGLYDYYVDWNDDAINDSMVTLTTLFRILNNGDKLYIGDVIDYHF